MTLDIDTQNYDLEIRIDTAAGEKLLDALKFPLHMDFVAEPASEQELEISEEGDEADHPDRQDSLDAIVEDVLNQPLIAHVSTVSDDDPAHTAVADSKTERSAQKRYDIRLQALSVIMTSRPRVSKKRPLTLTDINLQLHAEIKVGVRAWGKKWYWKTVTTPWLDVVGREATLKLSADGSRILAMPELENTDVVIALKLWKWHLRCKLGASRIINRQLGKRGPFQIVEFGDFKSGSQFLGKQPRFEIQSIKESAKGVLIKTNIDWC